MTRRLRPIDFGFKPWQSPHHFAVILSGLDEVTLVERFTWETSSEAPVARPVAPKAILNRYRWSRIEGPAGDVFNERLQRQGDPTAVWKPQETVLAPHLGKELVLLAWAVEDADDSVILNMIGNWRGLAPEERWWLYTTINATSGHPEHGKDRGWRQAIKIAFADNPILAASPTPATVTSALLSSSARRKSSRETPPDGQGQLPLE